MNKAVNIVIKNKEREVLVLKRSPRESWYPGLWNLPGGGMENGEDFKQAVVREAKEETDLDVDPMDHYFDVYYYPSGREKDAEAAVYAFEVKTFAGKVTLDEDHTDFQWVSERNWKDLRYSPSCAAALDKIFSSLP